MQRLNRVVLKQSSRALRVESKFTCNEIEIP